MQTGLNEYRFGTFTLQPVQRRLLADGCPVKLGGRAFDLLLMLVERRDRVMSKGQLLDLVWPHVIVAENNLEVQMSLLRKLLGPQVIVTIPGRGYRFVAPLDEPAPAAQPPPPPTRTATFRTNLPEHLPELIGRDDDLAALSCLAQSKPLVTIVGGGGIGKTLLALHMLNGQRHEHPHGVCWVELGALNDPSLIPGAVAKALGLELKRGDPLAALEDAIAPLDLLLALDNAEHLLDGVARVVEAVLAKARGVQVLVTSQESLKLVQEHQYRLEPLAVPERDVAPEEALRYGAVALFVSRARAAQRQFQLTANNVASVCAVCRQLDGCALAIELAAARLPLLGVERLAGSLDERLRLLTKGHHGAPERQQTLRAGLQWTYALLDPDQQKAFRRLAVFAGSFSLEMAQAVIGDRPDDRWRVIEAIDRLVDLSLVTVVGSDPRYRLLGSPHAFARECLAQSAEADAMQARHARAVRDRFVAVFDDLLAGSLTHDTALVTLGDDLDNARAAMQWALRCDTATAVALMRPLSLALSADGLAEASVLWQKTEPCLGSELPKPLQLQWTLGAAVHYSRREMERAHGWAVRAIALARQLGDDVSLSRALAVLADGRRAGASEERRKALDEMLRLDRAEWSPYARLPLAQAEALFAMHADDRARMAAALARGVALAQAAGSSNFLHTMTANIAELALVNGEAGTAVRLLSELVPQVAAMRRQSVLSQFLCRLAFALLVTGDLPGAHEAARSGWNASNAPRADLEMWALLFSLLAARDGRARTSARLLGCADAMLDAHEERRDLNQARAADEVKRILDATLDVDEAERLRTAGREMREHDIGDEAFASRDSRNG